MRWKAIRQLAKNGNSLTVAIPRQALHGMKLLRHDYIEMVYDEDAESLTLKAQTRREVGPPMPRRSSEMVEVQE